MDHFGEVFANMHQKRSTKKSSPKIEEYLEDVIEIKVSPPKKISSEKKISPPKRESKIKIINPLSPRTKTMRKERDKQRMLELDEEMRKPKVPITNPNPLRLNMTRSIRHHGIDDSVDIEDTTKFPLGRTMHECSRLVNDCRSISQLNNRGAYTIIYNKDSTEKVIPTFNQLVKFITDDYMTTNRGRIPHHQRPIHEARVINTLIKNGIVPAATGIQTKKNNKKRKGTRRKRKK